MHVLLPAVKWDPKIDGIDFGDFAQWLEDYERSLVPAQTIFPQEGQLWEVMRECELTFHVRIAQPTPETAKLRLPDGSEVTVFKLKSSTPPKGLSCFPGGLTRLEKGEQVRVVATPQLSSFCGPKPIRVSFQPLQYEELHTKIVPAELRKLPGYKGYW